MGVTACQIEKPGRCTKRAGRREIPILVDRDPRGAAGTMKPHVLGGCRHGKKKNRHHMGEWRPWWWSGTRILCLDGMFMVVEDQGAQPGKGS